MNIKSLLGIDVKKIALLAVLLISFVIVLFMVQEKKEAKELRPLITVSTFALYDIVRAVGGDHVVVKMVIPFGVEVHSFEPTPKTIMDIQKSKLFLYSGADLEPWIQGLAQSDMMRDMSKVVTLRKADTSSHKHESHEHGAYDPHYWLDIANMQALAKEISRLLVKIDSVHQEAYEAQLTQYLATLEQLQSEYEERLATCRVHEVVLHHNILGYVAAKYGFSVATLTGLSPDALADAHHMTQLSKLIKEKGINVIFFEAFISDRMMQNLAKENGISVDFLDPLANITADEAEGGMTYVEGMHKNLEKLAHAMRCQ